MCRFQGSRQVSQAMPEKAMQAGKAAQTRTSWLAPDVHDSWHAMHLLPLSASICYDR